MFYCFLCLPVTDCLIDHLVYQAEAGAQMLQVFESNAGHLSPHLFQKYCVRRLRKIGKTGIYIILRNYIFINYES